MGAEEGEAGRYPEKGQGHSAAGSGGACAGTLSAL